MNGRGGAVGEYSLRAARAGAPLARADAVRRIEDLVRQAREAKRGSFALRRLARRKWAAAEALCRVHGLDPAAYKGEGGKPHGS